MADVLTSIEHSDHEESHEAATEFNAGGGVADSLTSLPGCSALSPTRQAATQNRTEIFHISLTREYAELLG